MIVDTVTITCCNTDCGISFEVPKWWEKGKRENHSWFYCPNGHHQHFPAESEIERTRRERDNYKQQVARAEDEARLAMQRAASAERARKKLEKRTAAGTCPCCQRTFQNMAVHMRKQHPNYVKANITALKVVS